MNPMMKELLALAPSAALLNPAMPMFAMLRSESIHDVHRTLDEHAFYPAHDPRKESAGYRAVHKAMIVTEDLPCLICGVRRSTLKKKAENPWGATQMETHHAIIEWALIDAISVRKFVAQVVKPRAKINPTKYDRHFGKAEMRAWIDHDRDNLIPLCDVHHRHRGYGVHAITGPIWAAQGLLRDAFQAKLRSISRTPDVRRDSA